MMENDSLVDYADMYHKERVRNLKCKALGAIALGLLIETGVAVCSIAYEKGYQSGREDAARAVYAHEYVPVANGAASHIFFEGYDDRPEIMHAKALRDVALGYSRTSEEQERHRAFGYLPPGIVHPAEIERARHDQR